MFVEQPNNEVSVIEEFSLIAEDVETFTIDGNDWDHAIKFARWQHPAVGREARFDLSDCTCMQLETKGRHASAACFHCWFGCVK